jgi:hypothetical protein
MYGKDQVFMVVQYVEDNHKYSKIFFLKGEEMIKYLINIFAVLLFLFGCQIEESIHPEWIKPGETDTVQVFSLIQEPDFQISIRSLIQANHTDLLLTPAMTVDKSVLFSRKIRDNDINSVSDTVIPFGQGPNEAVTISMSSKNAAGDTLAFLSLQGSKILFVDNSMNVSEHIFSDHMVNKTGDTFAYGNGYVGFSIEPMVGDGDLIGVYNMSNRTLKSGFPLRVPLNMEPAIRNRVFSSAALPDGFVFAFTGDRKFYRVDYNAEVNGIYVLGESDPIEEPFNRNDANDPVPSRPHIPKMEYSNDHLHVLMDSKIWIIDLETGRSVRQLAFTDDSGGAVIPLEFSMNNKTMFIRRGRDMIYMAEIDSQWYDK